ncbi:hypothetical protein N1031_00310 [Herbiconiux moechotypicola]|uniref:Uncharacterized protein n=1 Tax=Herbiconiux moechotypicola TaxID=637393 RepID=A0ABN3D8R0_9MICO|nr:hypothetical protein [Herbiconiux moechotypicola]MCS5728192.1 hypothetical protein [Herbiconiux moechotypicola]
MTSTALWPRDLLEKRRALHSRVDSIAHGQPAAAARLRLALYTAAHRFDTRASDLAGLAAELDSIAHDLDARLAPAA